jgi:hypothetical protein
MHNKQRKFTVTDLLVYLLLAMIGISAISFVGYFLYSVLF